MKSATLFFKGLHNGFKLFGNVVNTFIVSSILFFVFIFGIGIVSVISKTFGKRFIILKQDPGRKSYWDESIIAKRKKEDFLRPF